jgi:hypothetical protein
VGDGERLTSHSTRWSGDTAILRTLRDPNPRVRRLLAWARAETVPVSDRLLDIVCMRSPSVASGRIEERSNIHRVGTFSSELGLHD